MEVVSMRGHRNCRKKRELVSELDADCVVLECFGSNGARKEEALPFQK